MRLILLHPTCESAWEDACATVEISPTNDATKRYDIYTMASTKDSLAASFFFQNKGRRVDSVDVLKFIAEKGKLVNYLSG